MKRTLAIVWLALIVAISASLFVLMVRDGMAPPVAIATALGMFVVWAVQCVAIILGFRWMEAALSFLTGVLIAVLLYRARLGGLAVGGMVISSMLSASTAISNLRRSRATAPRTGSTRVA